MGTGSGGCNWEVGLEDLCGSFSDD
ncbi:hypothetical protein F8388_026875, partial [Cannabis sativa]